MKKLLISLFVLFTVTLPMAAYAQDVGPIEVPGEVVVVTPEKDPTELFPMLFEKIQGGEWLPAFGVALMLIVYFVRKFAAKKFKWFATKPGGTVLAFSISLAMAFATALAAGQPMTVGLAMTALGVAWAAGGGWENFKDIMVAVRKSREAREAKEG